MKALLKVILILLFFSCHTEKSEEKPTSISPANTTTQSDTLSKTWKTKKYITLPESPDDKTTRLSQNSEGYSLHFHLLRDSIYRNEIQRVQRLFKEIEQEINPKELTRIWITLQGNEELLNDIAAIPSVQEYVRKQEGKKERFIIPFKLLSENIEQSQLFQQFLDIIKPYDLIPEDYIIEKCNFISKKEKSTINRPELWCPFIGIHLKTK